LNCHAYLELCFQDDQVVEKSEWTLLDEEHVDFLLEIGVLAESEDGMRVEGETPE
jgi:hypothetical protein